ncbi:hypothetical protein ACUW9M_005287, partial [Serratia sp. 121840015-2]
MVRFIPPLVFSEHSVNDGQKLAHTGNQRHFFGLACGNQADIKRLDNGVMAGCNKRGHIQRCAYSRSPTEYGSSPAHCPRVPIYRGYTDKRTDCTAREITKLGDFCQQSGNSHRTNAFYVAELISLGFKMDSDVFDHDLINARQFIFNCFDDYADAHFPLWMRWMHAVTLSGKHCDQLAAPHHYCQKNLSFSIRDGADKAFSLRMSVKYLRHLSQHHSVNAVSFRQVPHGTSKVSGLLWVDNGNLKAFSLKRAGNGSFEPAGGFHQNQSNSVLPQLGNNCIEPISGIFDSEMRNITGSDDIQSGLRHVDPHTDLIWQTHYYPSLQIRYGVRTTVRVSDEWLGVCAIRLASGCIPLEKTGCIHRAKPYKNNTTEFSRYKEKGLSSALITSLSAERTLAVMGALVENPTVALALHTHTLAVKVFGSRYAGSLLQTSLTPKRGELLSKAPTAEGSRADRQLGELHAQWEAKLPPEWYTDFSWLLTWEQAEVVALLAYCVGLSLDAVHQ